MSRSLLQPSPTKRTSQLKNSFQQPQFNKIHNASNFTQIIIETNDQEVPFVSIFKPNIKRQQRRIQAILSIQNSLKYAEITRISFAFSKIASIKYQLQHHLSKVVNFKHLLQKIERKRVSKSFLSILFAKIKKNNILLGAKGLNFFQSGHRINHLKHSFSQIKLNYFRKLALSLQNENSISKQLSQLKRELFQHKSGIYSKQLINKCKPHVRIIDSQAFIANVEGNDFVQSLQSQLKIFQEIRQEIVPKRKELFQNEVILNVMCNIQKAYQESIMNHDKREEELKQIIQGYTNKEGIEQLNQVIVQKESLIAQIQSFFAQLFKFDSELKRNQKQSGQKILGLLTSHEKRIQTKGFHENSLLQRIWNSRVYFHNLVSNMMRRYEDQKQNNSKQISELTDSISEQSKLIPFTRRVKDNSLKILAQFILNFHKKVKNVSNQNEQLKRNNQSRTQSVSKLLSFIEQIQLRMNNGQQVDQSFNDHSIHADLHPIFLFFVKIIQKNMNLSIEHKQTLRELQLRPKRDSIPYSETKPFPPLVTPKKNRLQSRQSQFQEFADHFLSPLKEIVQNRKEDIQLKRIMIKCEENIQTIIHHNHFLQEKLNSLEASDKIIQELTSRNKHYEERIQEYERQRVQKCSEASNYHIKIRQLTLTNGQLAQQLRSLKESFNQFNSIAHSNMDLSQKINQIYQKSKIQSRQQQQLMKQTELMKEIINHKIEFENLTMNHYKQLESLRTEINSYKTIITKLQTDLIQKQYQTTQLQSTIKTTNTRYQEVKQMNLQFKEKISRIERERNAQAMNRSKVDESELNKLKNQCSNIYSQLERQAQNINAKNYQIQSLQIKMKDQEKVILALRQEKQRLNVDFQDLIVQYSTAQQQISKYKLQIGQIKSQYSSIQLEFHKKQSNYSQISKNYQHIQNQLHQKQTTINNLIEQAKFANSSFASQLLQSKQDYATMQKTLQQKISQKDLRFSRLQFELNEKMNTITSLQQLISLYANNQDQLKKENDSIKHQYSRDKQIQYLCEQIKSLQEFVSDITLQYHELEIRYQQERERTNRSFTSFTPQKHSDIVHHYRQTSSQQAKNNIKYESSIHNNSQILQNQNDISLQLDKLLASNENLSYSVDFLREENKELFMKVKNISSTELIIELVFNILLNISKFKPEEAEAAKLWEDLYHLRAEYSGQSLFTNLQAYCSTFIQKYSRK